MCRPLHTHVESARSRARLVIALLGAGLLAGACADKPAPPPPPPPEVLVAPVVRRDVPIPMELVGQTRGFQDVEIRARVEGFLDVVGFQEGSLVRRGQVLYRIDRKPLEASLANVRAELGTAQARYEKTQNDVKRLQPLAAKQAVSAQELDNALAAQDAARSQVEARKADMERVSLDLGYTNVTSPIDGLVGTTLVKAGSLVGRGESTLLTTVSQIDPILFRAGHQRSRVPPHRAARRRVACGPRRCQGPHRSRARRRHRPPPEGLPGRGRACHRHHHGHLEPAVPVPEPGWPDSSRPVRAGAVRHGVEEGRHARASAGRAAVAEPEQRRRGRQRQQGGVQDRHRRPPSREPVGRSRAASPATRR